MAEQKQADHWKAKRIARVHSNSTHDVSVEFRYTIGNRGVVVRAGCDYAEITNMDGATGLVGLINQDEVEIAFLGAHYVDEDGPFDMGTAADALADISVEMLRHGNMRKFWDVLKTIYDLEFVHEVGALAWEQKKDQQVS